MSDVIRSIGLLADLLSISVSTKRFSDILIKKPSYVNYYRVRMEIGSNEDAGGHPPSIILTDFSGAQKYGVVEGTSKNKADTCRNNEQVSRGFLIFGGKQKFKGMVSSEAPQHEFRTKNGFNLKSVDIQAGSHAICVSNLVIKGGETQARPDQVFIPIGDLGYLCGQEWNWGGLLGDRRQRCLWIDGKPTANRKTIQSLHLDMERIPLYFDIKTGKDLKNLDLDTACSLFGDSSSYVPNRNNCKESDQKAFTQKNLAKKPPLKIETSSKDLKEGQYGMENFLGASFITSDNKEYISEKKKFKHVNDKNKDKVKDKREASSAHFSSYRSTKKPKSPNS